MAVTTPAQVHDLWTDAFNARDIPALLALYEPDAVLALSPDELLTGHDAIQSAIEGFLALRPAFRMGPAQVVQAGNLALLFSPWELAGTGPDGNEVRMSGVTSDVVRRQANGSWLIAIDNPFGGSHPLSETGTP